MILGDKGCLIPPKVVLYPQVENCWSRVLGEGKGLEARNKELTETPAHIPSPLTDRPGDCFFSARNN